MTLKQSYGAFPIKIHGGPYQQAGIPDILVCINGNFLGLEVKVPARKNNVTKLQEKTLQDIRDAGGVAAVVTSVEEAIEVIEEHRLDEGW